MIGDLYEIEAAIRGKPADERRRGRQEKGNPLLGLLEMSMREKLATLWPKAPLVEAINYAVNRWDGLTLFCDDDRVEIGNVLAENALRCAALDRRNFMFAGSDSGGKRAAAAMYSLIVQIEQHQSTRLSRRDPFPKHGRALFVADAANTVVVKIASALLLIPKAPPAAERLSSKNS